MTRMNVLIVDDQRDVRRILRTALETSGRELQIFDVPSGEEAILVISRYPIQLLVADVRLPGISGLELIERARLRNPELKLILITGLEDPKIRRAVQRAGADAYFYKPIKVDDFLQAVWQCLGQASEADAAAQATGAEAMAPSLADRLARLRQDLDAECAILISDHGQVMAQAGELPLDAGQESLISSLMATYSAALKVSYALEARTPQNWLYFNGQQYDFILLHVGASLGLLLGIRSLVNDAGRLNECLAVLQQAIQDVQAILNGIGLPVQEPEPAPEVVAPEVEEENPEALQALDALLAQAEHSKLRTEEVEAFWDSLASQSSGEISRADAISYEQARQLGLAPEE